MASFGVDYTNLENDNFVMPSSDVDYNGLVDTTQSFTGGNFGAGDVLLGSPVPLGMDYATLDDLSKFGEVSVPDYGLSTGESSVTNTYESGSYGSSGGGIVYGTAGQLDNNGSPISGTHANVNGSLAAASYPTDSSTWSAFGALSKIGSSFATLFGAHPSTVGPNAAPSSQVSRGNALNQGVQVGGVTGTNTILLVIVVGAVILLLARSKGE